MSNIKKRFIVNKDITNFFEEGYVVRPLIDQDCVKSLGSRLVEKLSEIMGQKLNLKDYHKFVQNDNQHIDIQFEMLMFLHESELHLEVLAKNRSFFESLMGGDIDVQASPHLRIARPGKPQDNIGFHVDIDYGNSCYEMSCVMALNDLDETGALKLLPASHAKPSFKTIAVTNDKAPKGSKLNRLGVPYSYKQIVDESYKEDMVPIPMNIGEVLCFNQGLVHGQEVNNSLDTRWSVDCRLKSIFAPTNTREGYYRPFFKSPMTQAAEKYLENNKSS